MDKRNAIPATAACAACELHWTPERLTSDGRCPICIEDEVTPSTVFRTEECWACHGTGEVTYREEVPVE